MIVKMEQFESEMTVYSYALRYFKGAIESLPVLGTKIEKASQDFCKFTKALHNYVLANFSYLKDIAYAITDFKDPIRLDVEDLPIKMKLMRKRHLVLQDDTQGTDEEKSKATAYNKDLEETIDCMRRSSFSEFNKRKTAISLNMAALWGFIMG